MAKEEKVMKNSSELVKLKKNIGMHNPAKTEKLAKQLSILLADSYSLYIKTQNFHWNVTGPLFSQLHQLFEEQYTDLIQAIDEAAERIRALGHFAPGGFEVFAELSNIEEAPLMPPLAMEMVRILAEDQKIIAETCQDVIELADDLDDNVTEDYAIQRLKTHEKNAWMLSSMLEK